MNKDLIAIFEYLEREKGIKRELVIAAIEESLQVAARKSISGASNVTVHIHPKTGKITVYCEKKIVDLVEEPSMEISLEDARVLDPEAQMDQFIDVAVTPKDFGRIAAQKARQIISQKLRGAERDVIYEEYRHRTGELVSGTIKRFFRGANLVIDLGKVEAIMPARNYPKTEKYKVGDKVLALLAEVRDTENEGAEVVLSRSSPEFVRQLMMQEVPEINDGTVTIEKVVRDAGYRTKMTVRAKDIKVDPVGACVGMRGLRVKNVVRELNNEKVDIIPYSAEKIELLQRAIAPVEIRKISVSEDENLISLVVEDEEFPIVIGKRGMNARLTGELIGATIEVQRMSEYNKSMAIRRCELATVDNPLLDEPITHIDGIPSLIMENLVAEDKFNTARKILMATPEELTKVPGIGIETAYKVLEQVRKGFQS